jgi:hypothetical protein
MLVRDVSGIDGGFMALLQLSADGIVRVKGVEPDTEVFWKEREADINKRRDSGTVDENTWVLMLGRAAGPYTNLVPVDAPDSDFDKEFDTALAELGYSRGVINLTSRPVQQR